LTYVSLFYTQLNGNERKITYVSGINLGKSGNGWNIHSKKMDYCWKIPNT